MDDDKSEVYILVGQGYSDNYSLFGNVLVFDRIHEKNKDHMIFTPFTRVNRHKSQ